MSVVLLVAVVAGLLWGLYGPARAAKGSAPIAKTVEEAAAPPELMEDEPTTGDGAPGPDDGPTTAGDGEPDPGDPDF